MKKDKDTTNRWSPADEATLVHTLASAKAKGHIGDNGFKKPAWTACEEALQGSERISGGTAKTPQSIKSRWQRVRGILVLIFMRLLISPAQARIRNCQGAQGQVWVWLGRHQEDRHSYG